MEVFVLVYGASGSPWYKSGIYGVYSTAEKAKEAKRKLCIECAAGSDLIDNADNLPIIRCVLNETKEHAHRFPGEIDDDFNYQKLIDDNIEKNWESWEK